MLILEVLFFHSHNTTEQLVIEPLVHQDAWSLCLVELGMLGMHFMHSMS